MSKIPAVVLTLAIAVLVIVFGSRLQRAFADEQFLSVEDIEKLPSTPPIAKEPYGPDPLQFGELRLPHGKGPFPVAVLIHGGCWVKGFATQTYMAPLATELAARGMATWNIEYRQIGDAGAGWPGSFQDWAAATDYLRTLAQRYPIDLNRVVTTGHSAGAHAALWLAARGRIAKDSPLWSKDPLRIGSVVAIDGPGDVRSFIGRDQEICGQPVMEELFGGLPAQFPRRYAAGDPIELLPTGVPATLIPSSVLLPEAAEAYGKAAARVGDAVQIKPPAADVGHFGMMSPNTEAGKMTVNLILRAGGLSRL